MFPRRYAEEWACSVARARNGHARCPCYEEWACSPATAWGPEHADGACPGRLPRRRLTAMANRGTESTPEAVFSGSPRGLVLCRAVERLIDGPGPARPGAVETRVTKSQVAFHGRRRGFAYVWWPGRYVRSDVPTVLSITLRSRIDSPRFKSVISPYPGLWMHHLELHSEDQLDPEVASWLRQARDEAG